MTTKTFSRILFALLPAALLALTGCWTPPNPDAQPTGQMGLIQSGIRVESFEAPATVKAFSPLQGTITLELPDGMTTTLPVGPDVKEFEEVHVGQRLKVTLTEELAVYALDQGRLPDGQTVESLGVNARVYAVDPSYRLLTVKYPRGGRETFKLGLGAKMELMKMGDSVVLRPISVAKIRIERS